MNGVEEDDVGALREANQGQRVYRIKEGENSVEVDHIAPHPPCTRHPRPEVDGGRAGEEGEPQLAVLRRHEESVAVPVRHRREDHREFQLGEVVAQDGFAEVGEEVDRVSGEDAGLAFEFEGIVMVDGGSGGPCPGLGRVRGCRRDLLPVVVLVVADEDQDEGASVAVVVVAAGHGAEHGGGGERAEGAVGLALPPHVAGHGVPDGELDVAGLEEGAAVAAVEWPTILVLQFGGAERGGQDELREAGDAAGGFVGDVVDAAPGRAVGGGAGGARGSVRREAEQDLLHDVIRQLRRRHAAARRGQALDSR